MDGRIGQPDASTIKLGGGKLTYNWKKILLGGVTGGQVVNPGDPNPTWSPKITYSSSAWKYALGGLILFFGAPAIILTSKTGLFDFEYSPEFLDMALWRQYSDLLWQSTLVFFKNINVEIGDADLPKPEGFRAQLALVLVALCIVGAIFCAFKASAIIRGNLKTGGDNN